MNSIIEFVCSTWTNGFLIYKLYATIDYRKRILIKEKLVQLEKHNFNIATYYIKSTYSYSSWIVLLYFTEKNFWKDWQLIKYVYLFIQIDEQQND